MSTQVYYRKWRPRRFAEVVGQKHVVHTLQQALVQERVAHAYLFCGPRGTGKTSTARILAHAVNCLERESEQQEPCEKCAVCQAFQQNTMLDLIEIDAASNRGIDEIRSLRDKVHFAPGQSAYKIYIIDEAHMLTDAAFNAFLKTLEEPPPHTIFILATTEPHKVPATVISRCQRFDFRRISLSDVIDRLSQICKQEKVQAMPDALRIIAQSAGGSLRDAENTLEQLVTSYDGKIGLEEARALLGLGGDDQAFAVVKHLLCGNTTEALQVINNVATNGLDLRPFHRQILDYLRGAMLLKAGARNSLEYPNSTIQELSTLISSVHLDLILRAVGLFGTLTLRYDSPSPLPLELAAIQTNLDRGQNDLPTQQGNAVKTHPQLESRDSTHMKDVDEPRSETYTVPNKILIPRTPQENTPDVEIAPPPTPSSITETDLPNTGTTEQTKPHDGTDILPELDQEDLAKQTKPHDGTDILPELDQGPLAKQLEEQWPAILKALSRYKGQRFNLGALLRDCRNRQVNKNDVVLTFTHRSHMERMQEEMEDPRCRKNLIEVFHNAVSFSGEVLFESIDNVPNARSSTHPGHLVKAALGMGGKLVQVPDESAATREESDDQQKPA